MLNLSLRSKLFRLFLGFTFSPCGFQVTNLLWFGFRGLGGLPKNGGPGASARGAPGPAARAAGRSLSAGSHRGAARFDRFEQIDFWLGLHPEVKDLDLKN